MITRHVAAASIITRCPSMSSLQAINGWSIVRQRISILIADNSRRRSAQHDDYNSSYNSSWHACSTHLVKDARSVSRLPTAIDRLLGWRTVWVRSSRLRRHARQLQSAAGTSGRRSVVDRIRPADFARTWRGVLQVATATNIWHVGGGSVALSDECTNVREARRRLVASVPLSVFFICRGHLSTALH